MLWGAFNNASTAMQTFTTDLGSISQNIANVNTTGYKRQEMMFSTVMSEHHAAPATSVNGLNIFGVQATQRNLIDVQGVIAPSTTWSDLAINGQGYFMLGMPTKGTTAATTAAGAGASTANVPATPSIDDPSAVMYTRGGAWHRAYGPDTDSTLARSYFLNSSGGYLLGWMADSSGNIPATGKLEPVYTLAPRPIANNGSSSVSDTSAQDPSAITMPGRATTMAKILANLPSSVDVGSVQKIPVQVFDSNYNDHTVTLQFTHTGNDTWTMTADPGTGGTTTSTSVPIVFDTNGRMTTPADGKLDLSLSWTSSATPPVTGAATVSMDMSKISQYDDASVYIGTIDQDGYGKGTLMSTSFNELGELSGYYDNGRSRTLFKVPVANFVADNSLEPVSGTMFRRTAAAGDINVSAVDKAPGEGRFVTSSLETSTVNIETEFTRMIMTQKAYSSNAQVFKTADEMTTTARDLKA
jgi:flagellar hook protein FlgE